MVLGAGLSRGACITEDTFTIALREHCEAYPLGAGAWKMTSLENGRLDGIGPALSVLAIAECGALARISREAYLHTIRDPSGQRAHEALERSHVAGRVFRNGQGAWKLCTRPLRFGIGEYGVFLEKGRAGWLYGVANSVTPDAFGRMPEEEGARGPTLAGAWASL